jgi:hypothetical protein
VASRPTRASEPRTEITFAKDAGTAIESIIVWNLSPVIGVPNYAGRCWRKD